MWADRMRRVLLLGIVVLLLSGLPHAGMAQDEADREAEPLVIEVAAGEHDRRNTPVGFELPPEYQDHEAFTMRRVDNDEAVPVQVEPGAPPRLVWLLGEKLPAGERRRYRVEPAGESESSGGSADRPRVVVESADGRIIIGVGEKPVLRYNADVVPSPDPEEPWYRRSGYIHPLYNPAGQQVTGDFHPAHTHQHGIMYAWTNTTFEGRDIDFWNQKQLDARIGHVRTLARRSGPVYGEFVAELRHTDLTAPGGPKPVLEERWAVRVYRLDGPFLVEIRSTQRCAGSSPLRVNQYRYGGMAMRGTGEWMGNEKSGFLTSEGKTREDGNHTRPVWTDMHGPLDGEMTGVTVINHPENFRFPQPVRLHPSDEPYFVYTPHAFRPFTIQPGKPYTTRYRYHVHLGEVDPDEADRLFNDFAEPPAAQRVTE